MLSESVVKFIINEAKKTCDPSSDRNGYINALFENSLDVVEIEFLEIPIPEILQRGIDDMFEKERRVVTKDKREFALFCDIYNFNYLKHAVLSNIADTYFLIGSNLPDEYLEKIEDLSSLLSFGLANTGIHFGGVVMDVKDTELENVAINQVRRAFDNFPFDPVSGLQNTDSFYKQALQDKRHCADAVLYTREDSWFPFRPIDEMEPIESFDTDGLFKSIQIKDEKTHWLFLFSSLDSESVEMTYLDDSSEVVVDVSKEELYLNKSRSPIDYVKGFISAQQEKLGSLARIQRGTSIRQRDLNFGRNSESPSFSSMASRNGVIQVFHKGECEYLDQSCIKEDGTVVPYLLSEMPKKQERYTIMPDDGLVILVSRNGEDVASFKAVVPTLFSSNIFVVFPKKEIISAEYLACALMSNYERYELRKVALNEKAVPFLSKKDLAELPVIMLSEEFQDKIVERDRKIQGRIQALCSAVKRLQELDRFDPLLTAEETYNKLGIS